MKRWKIVTAALVALALSLELVSVAYAQGIFRSGSDVTVAAGETHDGTLFASGQTVDIAGTVNGDVFCAAQSITVTGTVNGDVLCAGQTVNISGTVTGSVRTAGQAMNIDGKVGRNLSAAGQSVTIGSAGTVGADAMMATQSATLDGNIGRDLFAAAGAMTVNDTIGRNIESQVNELTLGDRAQVMGNISYTSERNLSKATGAQVVGTVTRHQPVVKERRTENRGIGWGRIFFMLFALMLMALVAVLLFPSVFHVASEAAMRAPLKTFGLGVLVSIVAPVVVVILFVTVLGIPLALVAMLTMIAVWAVAWLFAAYYLGRMLLRHYTNNSIWYMLLGAAIIVVVGFIPFLGFLLWLAAFWLGLGMVAMHATRLPRPQYQVAK